ncbi:GNAT family N-acetyltransferase [Microbacterium gorillae]|uniref:GNAT family N-acetyltransferase n=1 Tax=Microbacterium gorillae TaxID=1231063 RepID=UPI003D95C721
MNHLHLRLWSPDDVPLLRAANSPEMTAHLNGPESDHQLTERHERYLRLNATDEARMFVIVDEDGHPLGSIGYWPIEWRGEAAWETGWFVLPDAQGQGVASQALGLLIDDARSHPAGPRPLVAFPGVDNPASNGVCRRRGFTLAGTVTEQFRGSTLAVNEWVLELASTP